MSRWMTLDPQPKIRYNGALSYLVAVQQEPDDPSYRLHALIATGQGGELTIVRLEEVTMPPDFRR